MLLLYPFFYYLLQREDRFFRAFRLKRFWSRIIRTFIFCPISKEFKADLPKPPFVIASNHSSHLDTVFMYSVFDDYFLFMGKGELLKWPLFGLFFRKMDIPVQRENSQMAYKALQSAYDAIDKGQCIALYPEGTIPLSAPRMKAFKKGAFKMAAEKNIPIVPVTWQSCYRVINNPERIFSPSHPAVVRAVIHPAVYPTGSTDEAIRALRDEVFICINSALPRSYQRSIHTPEKIQD